MFIGLFETLKRAGVPVSLRELLDLHAVVERGVVFADMEAFYRIARTVMVKDERHFDRFDRAFAAWIEGLENLDAPSRPLTPVTCLPRRSENNPSPRRKPRSTPLAGPEHLMEPSNHRWKGIQSRTPAATR